MTKNKLKPKNQVEKIEEYLKSRGLTKIPKNKLQTEEYQKILSDINKKK